MDPVMAKRIKANDAIKHRPSRDKRERQDGKSEPEIEEDPWKKRLEKLEREKKEKRGSQRPKLLVEDEDVDD